MDSDAAAKIVKQSNESYSMFVYDVPNDATYLYYTISNVIRKKALFLNLSCYLVKTAQRNEIIQKIEQGMEKIKAKRSSKGLPFHHPTYYIIRYDPQEKEQLFQLSINELNKQIREVGQSLLARIERLRKKVEEKECSKEEFDVKYALAIKKAHKDVDEAQGLALLFLIDKDVVGTIETTLKLIESQKKLQEAELSSAGHGAS
jgi:hypothetical protein